MMSNLVSEILFGFTGLISIINPIAIAFVFLERTASLTEAERAALAKRVSINAFFVLVVVFFVGTPILHFFGISMEALRIGAGLAVAVSAWNMLNAPDKPANGASVTPVDPDNATSTSFFPMTVPLTTGPGTMATAIALNANRSHTLSVFAISAVASVTISFLVLLVIWFTYHHASTLARCLGKDGTKVAVRVAAFLLLCIGMQIILTGLTGFLSPEHSGIHD
ncbi:MarC family protein [Paraburkholderia bannensis]|uniref:MarC family protein n=1 Tax=Paraburkholderia bannensis TaxID=765414 RepID=UPI002AB67D60|nr:MarC family protein [Paraburkholderia bannensis]